MFEAPAKRFVFITFIQSLFFSYFFSGFQFIFPFLFLFSCSDRNTRKLFLGFRFFFFRINVSLKMEIGSELEKSNVKAPEEGTSMQMDSQESLETKVPKEVFLL